MLVDLSLANITMPREGVKKDPRCFNDEEIQKMIANAPEPLSTILAVTAVLGLRIGETLALRVSDVDFTEHIIRIRQSR
jgi:integrase